MAVPTTYQKMTITNGDYRFSIFCTEESLQSRRDEITLWVDRLARKLHWNTYDTTISTASEKEALVQPYALFEHRFPAEKG